MVGRIIFIGSALYYLYLKFMLDSFGKLAVMPFWAFLEILIIHKPSLRSRDGPHKICSRSVQPFWRLLDPNSNKQTDKQSIFMKKKKFTNEKEINCLYFVQVLYFLSNPTSIIEPGDILSEFTQLFRIKR